MPGFFLPKIVFIFHCNTITNFESVFFTKIMKGRWFIKCLERTKLRSLFCLHLGSEHLSEKKCLRLQFCCGRSPSIRKNNKFWTNCEPHFLNIWGRCNCPKYIRKDVNLSRCRELKGKCLYSFIFMYINIFLFRVKSLKLAYDYDFEFQKIFCLAW